MSDLEEALTIRKVSNCEWLADADARYEASNAMFGGWTAAVALRSVHASASGTETPATMTVNYISMIEPGSEVLLRTSKLGASRSIHHWRVDIVAASNQQTLAMASVVLAKRIVSDGHTEPKMPNVPDPESLTVAYPPGTYGQRTIRRPIRGYPPFNRETTTSLDWVRDMTGRRVDYFQLAFLADSYAPRSFFWSEAPRKSATISISIYFHGTPEEVALVGDDYLLNEAIGTRGASRTSGQRMRLWSRSGALLVSSEQMHWFR